MTEPGYVAVFLELVRMHLPSLTSVTLIFYVQGLEWSHNTSLWDVLARFSHLQKLQIHFGNPEGTRGNGPFYRYHTEPELPLSSLRALSSLSNLSSLTVTAPFLGSYPPQNFAFLSCLTYLTNLTLPLVGAAQYEVVNSESDEDADEVPPLNSRMAPFASLTQLQSLALAGTSNGFMLAGPDCSSLAQLTSLTKLQLKPYLRGLDAEGLLHQLLTPLQQLQVLQLPKMKPSVALPVLAGLVNLRELSIDWEQEAQGRSSSSSSSRRARLGLACPSIRSLSCEGSVPVEAFPEVSQRLQFDIIEVVGWWILNSSGWLGYNA